MMGTQVKYQMMNWSVAKAKEVQRMLGLGIINVFWK
jgi:hypothetical protein